MEDILIYTNTKSILENDFTNFPPKPLGTSTIKPVDVKIKKYTKYVQFKKNLKNINIIVNSKINKSEDKTIYGLFLNEFDLELISSSLVKMTDIKLILIFFKLISPVWALIMIARKKNSSFMTKGLVDSFHQNTIFYMSKPEEHIISHENIHILQARSLSNMYALIKFNPNKVIDEYQDDSGIYTTEIKKYLKYLCKQSELEARLHELVVSIYRREGRLPQNFDKTIQAIVKQERVTRSPDIDYDFFLITGFFIDSDRMDFFLDVLIPLLYSNLISYYGDNISSYKLKRNALKMASNY